MDALRGVVVLGVLDTGLAYIWNYRLITDDGPTVISTVTYLIPVVAVLFGAAVLGESVSLQVLAGMVIILAGVGLVRRTARQRPSPAVPARPRFDIQPIPASGPRYVSMSGS
ncbi:MAG TPA: DMT family transporter [Pseudonocardiaceae bacterium]|nr:DMT family transporter [Pseudonocardiaceae bacterium]